MLNTNLKRIKNDIETISEFNSTPGNGFTRLTYSDQYRGAMNYLKDQFSKLGLKIMIDPVGNLRARLEGKDPEAPLIMFGSHIDTVLHGGMFDGVTGVVGALEVIRVIIENNIKLNNPVEAVIFVEEEGTSFGSFVGSEFLTGLLSTEDLKGLKNERGLSLYEAARNYGIDVNIRGKHILKPGQVKAMLELHVEQSIVLDSRKIPVGIVQAIAGIKWFEVELRGVGNHAGATPMGLRQDPMVGAAEIIAAIKNIAKDKGLPSTVATVGKIKSYPNVVNVIPERVKFTIDLRDIDIEGINRVEKEIKKKVEQVSDYYGLEPAVKLITETEPVTLTDSIINIIEESAQELDIDYLKMNSGAGHDTEVMAGITDVGMIFVPSVDGRSHVPEEYTEYEDIKTGCNLLLAAVLKLAQ